MSDTTHQPQDMQSFGARVKSAVFWRSGSQIIAQIVMWGSTLLVIRILEPSDYGLFAMSQTIMVFLAFLNGYGFAGALIQSENVEPIRVRQTFGMLLLLNTGLTVLQICLAPYVADYYGQPMIASMLRWMSLTYLATPFMVVPEVMMSRTLNFRNQAYVNLAAACAGAITALVCAFNGLGVWTLVFAPVVLFWTRAIGLTWMARLLVWPSFNFRGAGAMFGFGSALLGSHVLWTIQMQADIFIAGRLLSPHQLGLYAEALFVAALFSLKFVPPLNEVAFPAYARLQHDKAALSWSFLKAARLILLICCPVYLGMAVTATPFVATIFGEKWLEMVPFIQIIAFAMPFMTLQILFAPAVNALGKPYISMQNSLFGAVLMPPAFYLAVHAYGAIGLAWVWLAGYPVITAFTVWRSKPVIGISALELLQACLPAIGLSALMAGLVAVADLYLMGVPGIAPWLRLLLLVAFGGLVYGALMRLLEPKLLREILQLVLRKSPVVEHVSEAI